MKKKGFGKIGYFVDTGFSLICLFFHLPNSFILWTGSRIWSYVNNMACVWLLSCLSYLVLAFPLCHLCIKRRKDNNWIYWKMLPDYFWCSRDCALLFHFFLLLWNWQCSCNFTPSAFSQTCLYWWLHKDLTDLRKTILDGWVPGLIC